MIEAIRHRGPDGFGFHEAPGVGFAHARLAIIDLATGDQPIHNETRTVWTLLNGEIFNYVELRRDLEGRGHRFYTQSDTEVIVHAYEQYGLEFVHELNGQFAIALWDASSRRLVLVRDRVGIRPLLYAESPDGLLFASEAKSLFASGRIRPALDPLALAEVCTFWSCLPPTTPFAGVNALPPGHLAVYEAGRLSVRKYWDWSFPSNGEADESRTLEDVVEELGQRLADAVRLQLRADIPVAAYLSGGLDSSAIVALTRRVSAAPLRTFSLRFADAEFDEGEHQLAVARHVGTQHEARSVGTAEIGRAFPRAIRHFECPVVRTAGVPLMLLADQVRGAGIKVVLTGEGADEVFAGYDIFKESKIRRFWARAPASTRRPQLLSRLYGYLANSPTARGSMGTRFFGQSLDTPNDPYFAHRLRWTSTARSLRYLAPEFRARMDAAHPLAQLAELAPRPVARWSALARDQYVEAHTLLSGYLLHAQGDRPAMAASIEARYPYLDHTLIEFANALPARWKLRGLTEKYVLRKAVAPWLPPSILARTKQPYRAPDSACFFRDGAPLDYVAELLGPAKVRQFGVFDPERVAQLVEKCGKGAAIGFADNMAFVIVLSTQLLQHEFVQTRRPDSLLQARYA